MARTINEIQETILNAKNAATELAPLAVLTTGEQALANANSTSKVAVWRLWVWIMAYCLNIHEKIVEANAEKSRPHTIRWYRAACLNFLDGLPLKWIDGQFQYDLSSVADVETRRIIDRCALLESNNGELVIKIATNLNGNLQPITAAQLVRFKTYLNQIKDAGNRLRIINNPADQLKIKLTVYVDASIIDLQTGQLLNTTTPVFPVQDAVTSYLENLEFNGAFVREYFRDSLQKATGVKLPIITELKSQSAGFPFQDIAEWTIANSGYFKINPTDLTIIYQANELGNN